MTFKPLPSCAQQVRQCCWQCHCCRRLPEVVISKAKSLEKKRRYDQLTTDLIKPQQL